MSALCPDARLTCVSSLDPAHFLEAWEYDDPARAVARVRAAVARFGGAVVSEARGARGVALVAELRRSLGAEAELVASMRSLLDAEVG